MVEAQTESKSWELARQAPSPPATTAQCRARHQRTAAIACPELAAVGEVVGMEHALLKASLRNAAKTADDCRPDIGTDMGPRNRRADRPISCTPKAPGPWSAEVVATWRCRLPLQQRSHLKQGSSLLRFERAAKRRPMAGQGVWARGHQGCWLGDRAAP